MTIVELEQRGGNGRQGTVYNKYTLCAILYRDYAILYRLYYTVYIKSEDIMVMMTTKRKKQKILFPRIPHSREILYFKTPSHLSKEGLECRNDSIIWVGFQMRPPPIAIFPNWSVNFSGIVLHLSKETKE